MYWAFSCEFARNPYYGLIRPSNNLHNMAAVCYVSLELSSHRPKEQIWTHPFPVEHTQTQLTAGFCFFIYWSDGWWLVRTIEFTSQIHSLYRRTPGITVSAAEYCSISSKMMSENALCSSLLTLWGARTGDDRLLLQFIKCKLKNLWNKPMKNW